MHGHLNVKFNLNLCSLLYILGHLQYFPSFIFIVLSVSCISRSYLWRGERGPEFLALRVSYTFVMTYWT